MKDLEILVGDNKKLLESFKASAIDVLMKEDKEIKEYLIGNVQPKEGVTERHQKIKDIFESLPMEMRMLMMIKAVMPEETFKEAMSEAMSPSEKEHTVKDSIAEIKTVGEA